MTKYNTLNVKLSNSQLNNKFKLGVKNGTKVTLNISSNVIGDSNYGVSFPHKLFLTDVQVSRLCKTFGNGSSVNTTFSKTQFSKMIQSEVIINHLIAAIPQIMLHTGVKALKIQ